MCNGKIKICDYSKHVHECYKFACEGSLLKLPPKGSTMKFMNYKNKMERPYIVYADMESTLVKYDDKKFNNQDKNKKKQCTTNRTHKHVVNSCCFYFVCTFDESKNKLWSSCEPDCVDKMIQELYILSESCIKEMRETQDMIITAQETNSLYNSKKCCICGCDFEKDDKKVRDHDHRTGKFRGPAHKKCHINYFSNRYLPVVFHNLKGYDGHMIIRKRMIFQNRWVIKKILK